jgi:hypothetical protein
MKNEKILWMLILLAVVCGGLGFSYGYEKGVADTQGYIRARAK